MRIALSLPQLVGSEIEALVRVLAATFSSVAVWHDAPAGLYPAERLPAGAAPIYLLDRRTAPRTAFAYDVAIHFDGVLDAANLAGRQYFVACVDAKIPSPGRWRAVFAWAADNDRRELIRRAVIQWHPKLSELGVLPVATPTGIAEWIAGDNTPGNELPRTASLLTEVPDAIPADNEGVVLREQAAGVVANVGAEFVSRAGAGKTWIDPTLALTLYANGAPFPTVATPAEADAVLLGWTIEDNETPPAETIAGLGIRPGTAVCVLTSFGTWRAADRRRLFDRKGLVEVFGAQPEFQVRAFPIRGGEGLYATTFRPVPGRYGARDLLRIARSVRGAEPVSVCMMVRNAEKLLLRALRSVEPIADEIVIVDTGSTDATKLLVESFAKTSGVPVILRDGTPPRYCYDCGVEHELGEVWAGHRFAGFETARNQGVALATGAWCFWLDADEELLNAKALGKYLRPNAYDGYGIPQRHFAAEPWSWEAQRTDLPVRFFRLRPTVTPAGLIPLGPDQWPTFHTGKTARFCGIVHEHPGIGTGEHPVASDHDEGIPNCIVLSDVWIAHSGYYTEDDRRGRFARNWPLMVADERRYPNRRLGKFLRLRDYTHHARWLVERAGNRLTEPVVELSEEAIRVWKAFFLDHPDAFQQEALDYVSIAYRILNRGFEVSVPFSATKPELVGSTAIEGRIAGRVGSTAELVQLIAGRTRELADRFEGDYL